MGVASNTCYTNPTQSVRQASLDCVQMNTTLTVDENNTTKIVPQTDKNGNPVYAFTPCHVDIKFQCALNYQMQWWTLFFEGILLISLFVSVFFDTFDKGKPAITSMFIMCTTLLMYSSNQFIQAAASNYTGSIAFSGGQAANNAGAAGYVLLSIFNFCLLISARTARDAAAAKRCLTRTAQSWGTRHPGLPAPHRSSCATRSP